MRGAERPVVRSHAERGNEGTLFGLAAGVVFNLLVLYQLLKLARTLDDIISIAVSARR